MKRNGKMKLKLYLFATIALLGLISCRKDPPTTISVERTVFVYMPWASNLLSYFKNNLEDLETSIVENKIQTDRFIVFLSESATGAKLFELKYENGKCTRVPLKSYTDPPFTTAAGISSILKDVVSSSSTSKYAMIIGSHGMGWIPVPPASRLAGEKFHWEYGDGPTRFFGGQTTPYQTNISTLAQGITDAGLHMEYILFDDCYMSNVETAYDLRKVTDYLIGCPTEVMAYGFPYHLVGEYLTGTVDYEGVAEGFYQFYRNYSSPYGTVAVTVCSELDALAAEMREINRNYPDPLNPSQLSEIQRMNGDYYTPTLFFDLGDYVARLCGNSTLLDNFNAQLERTVPSRFKKHTDKFPAALNGGVQAIPIDTYSGITVSDPTENNRWNAAQAKTTTAWWKATHD
jgi:hypothetical protein